MFKEADMSSRSAKVKALITTALSSMRLEDAETLLKVAEKFVATAEPVEEDDDDAVPTPVKPKRGKLQVEEEDEPEEDDEAEEDDETDDEPEEEEPVKVKKPKVAAKAEKTSSKKTQNEQKPVKKTAAKPAAEKTLKKATAADYSEMDMQGLKGVAEAYNLNAKKLKLKTAAEYVSTLNRIDKLAQNGPDKYIKLATKHEVDISVGRGRPPLPEKRARQVIVALMNAGVTV